MGSFRCTPNSSIYREELGRIFVCNLSDVRWEVVSHGIGVFFCLLETGEEFVSVQDSNGK